MLTWNILALCADFFILAGSTLQVVGKLRLRHQAKKDLSKTRIGSLPAGATAINFAASGDNLDIFGFLSIGVGSVYLMLNDLGFASASSLLLVLCLIQSAFLLIIGFETYAIEAENSDEVYMFRTWPLHIGLFSLCIIGSVLIAVMVVATVVLGFLDFVTASPLMAVSAAITMYLMKSLDTVTLRRKGPDWRRRFIRPDGSKP